MNSHDFTITSHTCRVCGTEVLCDEDTGARMHRDVTYDKACRELRNGRTEEGTLLAALKLIDETGSLRNFK